MTWWQVAVSAGAVVAFWFDLAVFLLRAWLRWLGLGMLRRAVVVEGSVGSRALGIALRLLPPAFRVVVVEHTRAVRLGRVNSVRLTAAPAGVALPALVSHAFRHRPDCLVVRGRLVRLVLPARRSLE